MKAEIYIKGTFDRVTRIGCAAYTLETESFMANDVRVLRDLDKGRGTYQAELAALVFALMEMPGDVQEISVRTNNKAVASWLSRLSDDQCCDEFYRNAITAIRNRVCQRTLTAEWIPKTDTASGNMLVNSQAHERLDREIIKHYAR